jgi:hypothetical protein
MHKRVKAAYQTPKLSVVGNFEKMTQGASTGSTLDATFPAGTPFGDLTFS